MESRLCQYMLANHGILPSAVLKIPRREKFLMWELLKKEMKEAKAHGSHK